MTRPEIVVTAVLIFAAVLALPVAAPWLGKTWATALAVALAALCPFAPRIAQALDVLLFALMERRLHRRGWKNKP